MRWASPRYTLPFLYIFVLWAQPHLVMATQPQDQFSTSSAQTLPRIAKIVICGNHHIRDEVILAKLPYKTGDLFMPDKSSEAIHLLYSLGYFYNIQLDVREVSNHRVILYVLLQENKLLTTIHFEGNKALSKKQLKEKLNLDKLDTINEEIAASIARRIVHIYKDEGYHHATANAILTPDAQNPDKVSLTFVIHESKKSYVTRVLFLGNYHLPDYKIRSVLFTRERWLLSFMDGSGKFEQEQFDLDKRRVEGLYRDHGYLNAKVTDIDLSFSPDQQELFVLFSIQEGEPYTISGLHAPGDDVFLESDILPLVSLEVGKPYSHTKLGNSIEAIKDLWGKKGYINADVYPQIIPNDDNHTVDITFLVDRGSLVRINRIDITGNRVTRDKVIRRQLDLQEGDIITSKSLQEALDSVERLSFFERGGVNWRMHRITDELTDLELALQEAQTGNFSLNLTYGSEPNGNERALKAMVQLSQANFMGRGWAVGLNAQGPISFEGSQIFEGYFTDPYLFGKNIAGTFAAYHRKEDFQEWHSVNRSPSIRESGGNITLAFRMPNLHRYFAINVEAGLEYMGSNLCGTAGSQPPLRAMGPGADGLQTIIDRAFCPSIYQWIGLHFNYDTRNHQIYPNHGARIYFGNLAALPFLNGHYSFFKSELEASYYTPLIGVDNLVLALHARAGIICNIVNDMYIPYKEMFHMGGQTTVRGFTFGSIEPSWLDNNPLGARKAVQFNMELIFPILPDFSMKGHFFYDGGAGWDTPLRGVPHADFVTRNKFNWRHAVGFGINIMRPMPAKIDWGYKLDRDKDAGESPYEFHIQMNMAW